MPAPASAAWRSTAVSLLNSEPRTASATASSSDGAFGLGEKGRCVPLHQAVQRNLLGPVSLVVDWGAIGRAVGLRSDGLHARLPRL
jgi:hypothetical protein